MLLILERHDHVFDCQNVGKRCQHRFSILYWGRDADRI